MTLNSDEHNTQQLRVFNRLISRNKWFKKLFKCFKFVFLFPEFSGFYFKCCAFHLIIMSLTMFRMKGEGILRRGRKESYVEGIFVDLDKIL